MSDYKITIDNTQECEMYYKLSRTGQEMCNYLDSACPGLGQPGCPFQPMPSCETCKFDKECNHNVTTKSYWSIFWSKRLTHCSAYAPEVAK